MRIRSLTTLVALALFAGHAPLFAATPTYLSALHVLPYAAKTGAKAYYASPTGSATAAGTLAAPLTLEAGLAKLTAGDTLYVRGGTYARSATVTIDNTSGNASSGATHVFAYQNEKPVLDFSTQAVGDAARGIQLNGSYWYFKGLEIKSAGDNGMMVTGNYNVVENCKLHSNKDTGLQISRKSSSLTTMDLWPKFNLIKNCESYNNSDALGENADGFAAKLTVGEGNAFFGCISHHNSDDGWDLFTKPVEGVIGTVTIDMCVAHHNGTLMDGTQLTNGDRNGFKLGGSDMAVRHIVTRSVAFLNGKNGFTWNSNPGNIIMANNLAFNNAQGNYKFGDNATPTTTEYYNNLSVWTQVSSDVADKYIGTDFNNSSVWWNSALKVGSTSVNGKGLKGYLDDFAGDLTQVTTVSRLANGTPDFSVFALATDSDLLNAGTSPSAYVPYTTASAYVGTPDIGPYEAGINYGTPSSSSSSASSSSSVKVSSSSSAPSSSSSAKVSSSSGATTTSSSSVKVSSSSTATSSSSSVANDPSSSSATSALHRAEQSGMRYDAARGLLFTPVAGEAQVQVFDLQGNQVAQMRTWVEAGASSLRITPEQRGVYLVRVELNGRVLGMGRILQP